VTKFNKFCLRWQTFQMVQINQSNQNPHDTNTVSTRNVTYTNRLMWPLAQDFIEPPNNNNKNNKTKMMTTNHWTSFTDTKEGMKIELLKSLGNCLYLLFVIQTWHLVSPHTIKFNSDSSLIDHSNSLTHFRPTRSFSRGLYWSQLFSF